MNKYYLNFCVVCVLAVSYTHLDVYKRQTLYTVHVFNLFLSGFYIQPNRICGQSKQGLNLYESWIARFKPREIGSKMCSYLCLTHGHKTGHLDQESNFYPCWFNNESWRELIFSVCSSTFLSVVLPNNYVLFAIPNAFLRCNWTYICLLYTSRCV